MRRAVDLSENALAERARRERVEAAAVRLDHKATRLLRTAARHRIGSNGRRKTVALSGQVRACAHVLASDEAIQKRVDEDGLLDAGWERLCGRVAQLLRQRDAKAQQP